MDHTIINSLKGGGGISIFCMETSLLIFKYLFLVHNFLVMVDYVVSDEKVTDQWIVYKSHNLFFFGWCQLVPAH